MTGLSQQLEKPDDPLIQYVVHIVIPRLRRADDLNTANQPYRALIALKSLIRSLYHTTETRDLVRSGWLQRIEEVENIQGNGPANLYRVWDTEAKRNSAAARVYPELEDEIWGRLHKLEYFKSLGGYKQGTNLNEESFEDADEQ